MEVHEEVLEASHEHRLLPRFEVRQRRPGRAGVHEDHDGQGVTVRVQHIRDANPQDLPPADLYVISSPGRLGKPKGNARRFLRAVSLEPGTRYAILTTQAAPQPDKKTGKLPAQEEQDRWERVIPVMNELLDAQHLDRQLEVLHNP